MFLKTLKLFGLLPQGWYKLNDSIYLYWTGKGWENRLGPVPEPKSKPTLWSIK